MADKTIKLTIDIQTKLNDLEGQVSKIQKEFDKLEGPKAATTPIENSLKSLRERFQKVREYINNNELSFADEKKAYAELRSIEKEYNRIANTVEANRDSFSLRGTAKGIESARNAIEEYKKATKEASDEVNKHQTAVNKLQSSIDEITQKRAIKLEFLETARKEAKDLNQQLDQVNNKVKKLEARKNSKDAQYSILTGQGLEDWGKTTDAGKALYGTAEKEGLLTTQDKQTSKRETLAEKAATLKKEAEEAQKVANEAAETVRNIANTRASLIKELRSLKQQKTDAQDELNKSKDRREEIRKKQGSGSLEYKAESNQVAKNSREIARLEKQIKEKTEKLESLTDKEEREKARIAKEEARKAQEESNKAQRELRNINKDIEDRAKQIETQQEQLETVKKAKKNEVESERANDTEAAQIEEEYNKALKEQAEAKKAVDTATEKAANAENDYKNYIEQTNKTLETNNSNLEIENALLKKAKENLKAVSEVPWETLKSELKALLESKDIHLNIDLDNIESVEDLEKALEKMSDEDKIAVSEGLKEIGDAAHEGAKGADDLNKKIEETGDSTHQLDKELSQIKDRVVHFFGLANAVNLFKRAVRSAFETVKDLDKVMTETAVVTDFSVGDMWNQLPEYTKRANELGVSIHDAYEAATLYYQQGLNTNEVMAVSNETLKMARIAGLDAADATDRMTNALRGFNMTIDETNAKNINDVYSNLAAKTASNVDEISTAMTKVASLASNANMSFENTAAFLSQIIETTRESAETAGTALKTVIARFSEVKSLYSEGELLGDVEGEEIDVNKVSKALRTAGINLNEYLTGAKGLDEIFMELSAKWDSLDQVQQRYIATMAAGSRQQSRFIALMQDNARMTELVGEANNAAGASQQQFEKTLESLQSKLEKLHNAWNTFLMGITNSDVIKFFVDRLTDIISLVNKLTEGLTGVPKSLANIGIAIGAFKLGKGILNKLLGNIGKALLPGLANIGQKGGEELTKGVTKGFDIKGLANNIKKGFKGFFDKIPIDGKIDFSKIEITDQLKNNLKTQLNNLNLNNVGQIKLKGEIFSLVNSGQLDQASEKFKQLAVSAGASEEQIAQFDEEIKKAGTDSQKTSTNIGSVGTACATAGVGLLLIVTLLEKAGVKSKPLLNTLKAAAIALMAMPIVFKIIEAAGVKAGISIQASFGWIGLVLAALAAIVALIATIAKQNSPAEKLKQAQEAAQAAADAAQAAKEAYDKLGDSFDSLSDKYKKLEDLIQGTREWRDAVFEINQQVLELTKKYPELAKLVTNKNGVLTIDLDSKAAQDVMDQYFNRSMQAANAEVLAQINVAQKNIDNEYDKLKLGPNLRSNLEQIARGLASGQGGATLDEQRAWVSEQLGYSYHSNRTIEALSQFGKLLLESDQQLDNFNDSLAVNAVHMAGLEGEQATSATNLLGSELIQTIQKKISDNIEENANNLKFDDAYRQYWTSRYGAVTFGNKGEISYIDENNTPQTISAELARSTYAAAQGADALAEAAKQFANGIGNASDEFQKVFAAKNGGALTKQEVNRLQKLSNDDIKQEFQKIYGPVTKENEAFWNQFLARTKEYIGFAETAIINAEAFFKKNNFDITGLRNLTSDQISGLSNVIKQVLFTSGKDVADDMLKLVTENKDFLDALKFVDLTDIKSIRNLETIFKDLGLESLTTGEDFKRLKNQLLEVALASQKVDVPKIKQSIAALSGISAKFMRGEATRTWSKEEYEAMSQYLDDSILKNFHANEDGSYTYLGNSMEELQKAVEENTTALREKGIEDIDAQIRAKGILTGTRIKYGRTIGSEGEVNNIVDAKDLPEYQRKQIFSGYLKQLKDTLSEEELEGLGLGISQNTKISDIINSDEFEAYWTKFMDLAMNESLKAEKESLSKEEIDELINSTNTELAGKGTKEAFGQLRLRGLEAGMSNDVFEQFDISEIGEFSALVTAYQQAVKDSIDIAEVEAYAKQLREINPNLKDNIVLSTQVALANTKLNTGLGEVISSYKDWTALIKDGKIKAETSEDFAVFDKLRKSVEKMLNVSEPLSDAFWDDKANIEALKAAAEGEVEAIGKLQKAAAIDYVTNITPEIDTGKTKAEVASLISEITTLLNNTTIPPLEPGVELKGYDEFMTELANMMLAAGYSVEQIEKEFSALGFTVEWGEDVVTSESEYTELVQEIGPDHTPFFREIVHKVPNTVRTPYIKGLKAISNGTGGDGISQNNITTGQGNKPTTSSSGSSSKPSYWKNPYDELFNLQEKINEALRDREELERRYQKLLKSETTTIDQIRKSYRDQIAMMQQQIELQRQLAAGRLRQIENLGNQYYIDSEGNRRTYASLGVTQYASYNAETGEFTIDWDRLEQIANDASRTGEGEAAEAYINALQELISSYEETRDAIWEIEDSIEELNNQLVESYMSFEERVMDALVASYQREIDTLQKINDAINDATSKVLDGIQKEIDAQRQERQNAKTEEDIAQKEARLAYLRGDTSGANSLEIMQLEQELEDMRENYEDTLIDQALQQMRDDADLAAEQRAEQITLMQAQLDEWIANGELWDDVYELISGAWDENGNLNPNSNLVELLRLADGTAAMSEVGQLEWWQQYVKDINKFVSGIDGVVAKYWDQLSPWLQAFLTELGANPEPVQTPPVSNGGNNGGNGPGGNGPGGNGPGGNGPGGQQTQEGDTSQPPSFKDTISPEFPYGKASATTGTLQKGNQGEQVSAIAWALHQLGFLRKPNGQFMTDDYFENQYHHWNFGQTLEDAVKEYQRQRGITGGNGKVGNNTRQKFKLDHYKTGGLADFTGPAWLDGTRTHPELVLNAEDTQNFIALKDILAHMFASTAPAKGSYGDNYFNIDINAELASDYDVDQLADRIKQQIIQDARYRNVNMINLMR